MIYIHISKHQIMISKMITCFKTSISKTITFQNESYTVYLAMNIVFISVSVMITISMVIPSEMFDCDFDNLMIEEFLSFSYLDVALRF